MTKSKPTPCRKLTEVELELMTILWRMGEGTVNEVIKELQPGRELAYSSVSTILRILEGKGVLATRREGRGHVYIPQFGKQEYETRTIADVVERVFDGAPVALVRQVIQNVDLSTEDIREIRKMLKSIEGKR